MTIKEEYIEELAFLEMLEIKDTITNYLSNFNIPYELDYRVKSLSRIKEKQLYRQERKEPYELLDIPDIIGFRISVATLTDVATMFSLINDYFSPERVVDYYNFPKETGYQAFNCFYNLWPIGTEIQIMTTEMRDWTNATHEEHNKRKYGAILTRNRALTEN